MEQASIFNVLVLSFFLLAQNCNKSKSSKFETSPKNDDSIKLELGIENYDYIVAFEWNGDFANDNIMSNLAKTEYSKYVKDFNFIWKGSIQGIGNAHVYKIILNGDQPGMYRGDKILIVNIDSRKAYILWLNKFEPMLLNTREASYYIGGRDGYNRYSNFYIYKMDRDTLFKIFESDKLVMSGRLDECKRYKEDNLGLSSKDIDNNGFYDIIFEGIEYNFCEGLNNEILEKPKDSTYIRIIYKTILIENKLEFIKQ